MPRKTLDLHPGDAFLFRFHTHWWQLWQRGFGGAQVIALEPQDPIVHLCILGMDDAGSIIHHLPITLERVLPAYVQDVPSEQPKWRDTTHAWQELSDWRSAAAAGEAAAFDIPLGEAVNLVRKTWESDGADPGAPLCIASAFPVRGPSGSFSVVRVIG